MDFFGTSILIRKCCQCSVSIEGIHGIALISPTTHAYDGSFNFEHFEVLIPMLSALTWWSQSSTSQPYREPYGAPEIQTRTLILCVYQTKVYI